MPRYEVTLHTEQRATVIVEVDAPLPDDCAEREKALTEAALAKLDESGGAEWETAGAYADWQRVEPRG